MFYDKINIGDSSTFRVDDTVRMKFSSTYHNKFTQHKHIRKTWE